MALKQKFTGQAMTEVVIWSASHYAKVWHKAF